MGALWEALLAIADVVLQVAAAFTRWTTWVVAAILLVLIILLAWWLWGL